MSDLLAGGIRFETFPIQGGSTWFRLERGGDGPINGVIYFTHKQAERAAEALLEKHPEWSGLSIVEYTKNLRFHVTKEEE